MITRVFCYSKEEAEKNGNKLPIFQLILTGVGMVTLPLILSISMFNSELDGMGIVLLLILLFMGGLIYFSIIYGIRFRTKISGFALDSSGKLYKAMTTNNGEGLYFGGMAAGKFLDQILSNGKSNLGGSIGGALGAYAQFSAMNRSAELMSHPEIIAQMVEQAKTITGGEVFAIEKVHSYTEDKHSVKIICDYMIMKTGKIKYNKKLTIEKSYNFFDELKNQIYNYTKGN